MGGKQTGTGKYSCCCIAILTCLLLSQCAVLDGSPPVQKSLPRDEPREHLIRAQKLLTQGDYETALEENQKALSLSANNYPGDEALYNMALIYAYHDNPKRDYAKSIAFFYRLTDEYAQSPWAEQARVWEGVLRESEELKPVRTVRAEQRRDEPREHLIRAQKLLAQGDYETALEENQKALSLSANNYPGDEALYNMALIYTYPGNPKRDYVKSIATFKRLIKEYPQSAWTEQAKIWVQVIQEGENAKRVAATVTQENDKLKGSLRKQ